MEIPPLFWFVYLPSQSRGGFSQSIIPKARKKVKGVGNKKPHPKGVAFAFVVSFNHGVDDG